MALTPPFFLNWYQADGKTLISGYQDNAWVLDGQFFPILYGTGSSNTTTLVLISSSSFLGTLDTFINITLSLTGPDTTTILEWPTIGGGVDISFDSGYNWVTFTTTNPSYLLAGTAIGYNSSDGILGPFEQATILLRIRTPNTQVTSPYIPAVFYLNASFEII